MLWKNDAGAELPTPEKEDKTRSLQFTVQCQCVVVAWGELVLISKKKNEIETADGRGRQCERENRTQHFCPISNGFVCDLSHTFSHYFLFSFWVHSIVDNNVQICSFAFVFPFEMRVIECHRVCNGK